MGFFWRKKPQASKLVLNLGQQGELMAHLQLIVNTFLSNVYDHMTDGFELKKAHQLANSHLNKLEYPDIPHSLGHGVGLQVHEMPMVSPYSDEKLVPGMVITVEPGIYMAGIGGVRIEDTILITNTGVELLTKSPKGLTAL